METYINSNVKSILKLICIKRKNRAFFTKKKKSVIITPKKLRALWSLKVTTKEIDKREEGNLVIGHMTTNNSRISASVFELIYRRVLSGVHKMQDNTTLTRGIP